MEKWRKVLRIKYKVLKSVE